jgi:hypothetical protein
MPFADICLGDRESCPNEWPVLSFTQDAFSEYTVTVRDAQGRAIPLDEYSVCLVAKDAFGTNQLYLNAEGIVDSDEGTASFAVPCSDLTRSGLFLGELVLFIPSLEGEVSSSSEEGTAATAFCSTDVRYRLPCYVEVIPNLANNAYWATCSGPLTIAEIRLAIRDKCVEDNFLLDNVEFSDTEIAWAIRRPVEFWNEQPPPLRPCYTPANFPYRYNWTVGVIGELLRIAGPHYERNRLRYSAGGLSVDDKDKASFYINLGDRYIQEYRDWVLRKKYSINVGSAFGSTDIASYGNGRIHDRGSSY